MNEVLTWILDAVRSVDPGLRIVLAGLAMMLETSVLVGLVVPGDTIVIVAGTGVASPLEALLLGVAVVLGSLLGETIGYLLGRWLGPAIRTSRLGRRIGEPNWQRSERYLERRGGPAIFISRFLPVLHSLVPLTVGMTGYPYRRFLAWTAPACVLWAALYISIAAAAAGTYRELADQIHFAGYIFVGIIVLFLVLIFVAKKVIERAERRHMTDADADADADASAVRGDVKD